MLTNHGVTCRPLVLIFFFILSSAFSYELAWHRGSIVFADRHVQAGEISIQSNELVLFRNTETVSAIPAYKIQLVRYYDPF